MVDQWIKHELDHKIANRSLVVIIDPEKQIGQLIPHWEKAGLQVKVLDDSLHENWQQIKEELFLRVELEKNDRQPTVIYSPRPKKLLSFLFDYTETHGAIDLTDMEEWLRRKLYTETGLQVQLSREDLMAAAKTSMGKDLKWWKSVIQKLQEIVDLDSEILPFLNDPEQFAADQQPEVLQMLRPKLSAFTGQPVTDKSWKILAGEVANQMFTNILTGTQKADEKWYTLWLDSRQYRKSLSQYLHKFAIPAGIKHWEVSPNHCFDQIDKAQLTDTVKNLHNEAFKIIFLPVLRKRAENRNNPMVPKWWKDIITVLSFSPEKIATLKSLDEVITYYTSEFHKLDRSVRNIYEHFLNEPDIVKPIQEYYENINRELIDKWFAYKESYKSNQQGHLVELIKNTDQKIAVIVGDGVRWEIADKVAAAVDVLYEVQKNVMLADLPSETEHNMSALYVGNNRVLKLQSDREKELVKSTGKEIAFKKLEDFNSAVQDTILVLTYKDVDSAGEKLQLGAIKLFSEFEKILTAKIEELLRAGYDAVHLITDHGFVLTGLLSEADKLNISINGNCAKSERYIRSELQQHDPILWSFPKHYENFSYLNVAQSDRPFRTPGVYGFSHGGFTPQEVIIPNFMFTRKNDGQPGMSVLITNKEDLKEVLGENFKIKLSGASKGSSIFENQREVDVVLYKDNTLLERSEKITLQKGLLWDKEYSFYGHSQIQVIVEDASTKEKLDQVMIHKSAARDLGGLL